MACEDIEQRLTELRAEKADVEEALEMLPPHKKDLVEANLERIKTTLSERRTISPTVVPTPGPPSRKTPTPWVSSGRSRSRRRARHGCGSG